MAIKKAEGGTMLTGVHIDLYRLMSIQKALKLELTTPLRGRGSLIKACQSLGFEGRTKKKALKWVTEQIENFSDIPSFNYKQGVWS
tara:strand:- start:512 stop:769 length:258 start_codon:yes stop_codon:yes gene_type:complete